MIYTPLQLHRTLRQRLYINGTEYQLDGQASISRDMNDFRATCDVTLVDVPPAGLAFTPFALEMMWHGTWERVFTGTALPKSLTLPAIRRNVSATDILYYLDTCPATEIEWYKRPYLDAVQDLLTAAGIPPSSVSLPSTTDLTARATVGVAEKIIIKTSDNIKTTMQKLMEFGGYRIYSDRNGIVRMQKHTSVPANTAAFSFSTDTPLDNEYGIYSIKNEIGREERIINKQIVSGRLGNVDQQPSASWSTSAVTGSTASISNDYCQSVSQCEELATELGQNACRQELLWNIQMPPDPTLEPGVCILVKSSLVGIDTFTAGRIIRQRFDGVDMELTISYNPRAIGGLDDGGEGLEDDGYDPPAPPIAAFSVQVEQEGDVYGLLLDANASSSDTSTISSYSWSITGVGAGYPDPALTGDAVQMVLIDTVDGVEIELTVTDANAETGTSSQTLSSSETEIYTRYLQAVVDGLWYVVIDWATGWVNVTPVGKTASACTPRSDTRCMFCGMSDGTVWRYDTEDSATLPVQVSSTSDGAVSAITQGEIFASIESGNTVAYSISNSLFVSQNALSDAPTWTRHEYDDAINAIEIDAYTPTTIKVAYGDKYVVSRDTGATFEVIASASGSDCVGFATFPWDASYAAIFAGATDSEKLAPYPGVAWGATAGNELSAITCGLTEEIIYVRDEDENIIVVENDVATVLSLSGGSLSGLAAMERDGAYNDIVWTADSGVGAGKIFAKSTVVDLGLSGVGTDIGYGMLKSNKETPPVPVAPSLYLLPSNQTGATDYIWKYSTSTASWSGITPPVASKNWTTLVIDPNDNQRMLLGYCQFTAASNTQSRLYYSEDGGANWYWVEFSALTDRFPHGWNDNPWQHVSFNANGDVCVIPVFYKPGYVIVPYPHVGTLSVDAGAIVNGLTLIGGYNFPGPGYDVNGDTHYWISGTDPGRQLYVNAIFEDDGSIYSWMTVGTYLDTKSFFSHYYDGSDWTRQVYSWNSTFQGKQWVTSRIYDVGDYYVCPIGNSYTLRVMPKTTKLDIGSEIYWIGQSIAAADDKIYSSRDYIYDEIDSSILSIPFSAFPSGGTSTTEYETSPEDDDFSGYIASNGSSVAMQNRTDNKIVFYRGGVWGEIDFPAGVTASMVSKWMAVE